MSDSTDYASFRQRLDAVLRTRDASKVNAFLIAEDQWSPGEAANPEYAMWMMIAGTATLKELHGQARRWLTEHGHAESANAVLKPPRENRPVSNGPRQTGQSARPNKNSGASQTGQQDARKARPEE
ncbi:MAG TPA: hypothetical protein VGD98_01185 [Ktedonobacteraceae bacterium]